MVAITALTHPRVVTDDVGARPRLRMVIDDVAPSRRPSVRPADLGVLCAVVVAVIALVWLVQSPSVDSTTVSGVPVLDEIHVVVDGETMWSIARDRAPAGEVAAYAERLVTANGRATVSVGQPVVLPVP